LRAGFPHSEILGSKPVCGLPGAYRTLQRPSSPVIAKASTTCTCSLDPITAKPSNVTARESPVTGTLSACTPCSLRIETLATSVVATITQTHASISCEIEHWTSSELLKNNSRRKPGLWSKRPEGNAAPGTCFWCLPQRRARSRGVPEDGGGERNRTDDPLLAKQVLSQLSYTPRILGGSGWIRTIDPRLIKTVL
jgi:hypothetical protein